MTNPTRERAIAGRLKQIVNEFSGYPVDDVVESQTFLDLGFDSLFLTQLATAFQNEFRTKITFRQLFEDLPSIAALSKHLDATLAADVMLAVPVDPVSPPAVEPVVAAAAPVAPAPETASAVVRSSASIVPSVSASAAPHPNAPAGSRAALVEAVVRQQLELMAQQLEVLRRGGASVASPAPMPTPAAAPVAMPVPAPSGGDAVPAEPVAVPAGFGPGAVRRDAQQLTPRQRASLDALIERYNRRTPTSKRMAQQYRRWHADPRTAAGFDHRWKEMVYPIVVETSLGSRLWDLDGNEYIDILNGFGPNFLGHSPPFITEALKAQLDRGIEVGPQTPLAGETAQLFCEMTGMDRVSFVNTGSEAVQAALRLARTYTGRDKVVVFRKDYHGNFDEVLVRGIDAPGGKKLTVPLAPGIPRRAVADVIVLDYGTEESLDIIRQLGPELAAVVVEPVQSRRPEFQPREFLHALRALTEQAGTLLVFDEVITGFRMCPGGAQAHFGVDADLATYGKVVGGGMPIGVVAGRARFMDTFDGGMWQYGDASFPEAGVTFFAGTFVRHPLAIAAANATLKYLKAVGPSLQEGVNRRTTRLTTAVNDLFRRDGIDIEMPHCCSQMFIRVNAGAGDLATLLFYHLRDRGVHLLEGFPTYMTAAHTDADVDMLIERFTDSVREMQDADMLPRSSNGAGTPASSSRDSSFALTTAQRDLWMASHMGDDASCAFNESDTLELRGALDIDAVRSAIVAAIGRHDALRMVMAEDGEEQHVRAAPPAVELIDLSGEEQAHRAARVAETLREQALRPFALDTGPLVRPLLLRLAADHHLLVVYAHHLVFDGWSADVLMRDIAAEYTRIVRGESHGAAPAASFGEYVKAQESFDVSEDGRAALEYWRGTLSEPPARLELPTDRPRGAVRGFAGDTVHERINPAVSEGAKRAARALGVTTHTLLLSAFGVLLSRLSMQSDFVVGVPAAGQPAAGLEDLVGYCVNLLPLRLRPAPDTSFAEFATAVRGDVLDAFEHQRADLATLVRELPLERHPSRLPLVEVVFNYSGYLRKLEFAGLQVSAHENRRGAVLHDLFFNVVEDEGQLVIDWDYSSDLFDEATIRQWVQHYEVLLGAIAEDPTTPVGELPLMSATEQKRIVSGWNRGASA